MKLNVLIATVFLLFTTQLHAQESENKYVDVLLEAQQYPTGFLLGMQLELALVNHHAIDFRLGYNTLDHQDFGVHESEKGGGFGFSLGYRYYFDSKNKAWFIGARSDLWFNEVDWKDNIGLGNEIVDVSKVVVLQPTVIGGYTFLLNGQWVITPTLAFGAEINIKTTGENVGEGAIFLWGLNVGRRF